MKTLLLDRTLWDLVVDSSGNIAVASNPYALAQDAASAIKLFHTEDYYDTDRGVPFYEQILGKFPPPSLMKKRFTDAALTVPEVVAAKCFLKGIGPDRVVRGQVQITDKTGAVIGVDF